MQTAYTINSKLEEKLERFFNGHNMALLNQNLRRLLVDFLDYGLNTGMPLYFDNFFNPFNGLLDVLDIAASEQQAQLMYKAVENADSENKARKLTAKEKVVAFIKASLNPDCIFLLHHSVTDEQQESFDLLVVIPANSNTSFTYYEQVISMATIEDVAITVSLHKAELIQAQLQAGHIYYSIACRQDNLLYASNSFVLPNVNKAVLKVLAEKATAAFTAAHRIADGFLNGAGNYWSEKVYEMSAFMLQQGIEITLRGLITALLGSCAKTHCLRELKKPLKRCAPEIEYLLCADAVEENRLLILLEKAYLEARYNQHFTVSKEDIDILTAGAEDFFERAQVVFEEKMGRVGRGRLNS